jgi:hypothetical protein
MVGSGQRCGVRSGPCGTTGGRTLGCVKRLLVKNGGPLLIVGGAALGVVCVALLVVAGRHDREYAGESVRAVALDGLLIVLVGLVISDVRKMLRRARGV